MIHRQFYIELGKLLYAVARADGIVQPNEESELNKIISEELSHHAEYYNKYPEYKDAILTKLSFYNCEREKISVKNALESYFAFFGKYSNNLHPHQQVLAKTLVQRIAHAFKGVSKQEELIIKDVLDKM